MKIGISRISNGPEQAKELIDSAIACGLGGIQFKTQQLKVWQFDPHMLLAIDPRAKDVAPAGVVYHPGGNFDTWTEPTQQVLHFVRELGGEHVCYCFSPPDDVQATAKQLNETGKRYADHGIAFSFHNHAGTIIGTLDQVRTMCDAMDPALCGLTFDTAHAAKCGMDDFGPAIRALASHITNVHLKDMDGDGNFCPIGTGTLNLLSVIEALRNIDYNHWLIVDEESQDYTTPQACEISAVYLREHGIMSSNGATA